MVFNRCSALNNDLYHANLIWNALCSCGKSDETKKHFLLHCKKYIFICTKKYFSYRNLRKLIIIYQYRWAYFIIWHEIWNQLTNTPNFLSSSSSKIHSRQSPRSFHHKFATADVYTCIVYCSWLSDLERLLLLFLFFSLILCQQCVTMDNSFLI